MLSESDVAVALKFIEEGRVLTAASRNVSKVAVDFYNMGPVYLDNPDQWREHVEEYMEECEEPVQLCANLALRFLSAFLQVGGVRGLNVPFVSAELMPIVGSLGPTAIEQGQRITKYIDETMQLPRYMRQVREIPPRHSDELWALCRSVEDRLESKERELEAWKSAPVNRSWSYTLPRCV